MTASRRILLLGGITLALLGMAYGFWYAVFAEHQALDEMGTSLAAAFGAAAQHQSANTTDSLNRYRQAKYEYDRQVDVHGHWIGLAMLLIVLAIGFNHVHLAENHKRLLAWGISAGAVLFPLGVLLETVSHGTAPKAIAVTGFALVTGALAIIISALFRGSSNIVS